MNCPYCVSDIADEAIVCKVCQRDLYLFKPLQARITELEAQLLEATQGQPVGETGALEPSVSLLAQSDEKKLGRNLKRIFLDFFIYLCLPYFILLAAHGMITILYDTKMIYLRIISIIIPFIFGYLLFVSRHRKLWPWLSGAVVLSVASVFGMSHLTSLFDHSPILPQSMFEWREFLEYASSIFFSFLAGVFLGLTVFTIRHPDKAKNASPLAKKMMRLLGVDGQSSTAKHSLLIKFETYGGSVATIIGTVFAIYTGLKRFL